MDARSWPGVRLVNVSSPAACVRGAQRGGWAGWYVLCNDTGKVSVRQAGRAVDLHDGELSLLRADLPYQIDFSETNRMAVVALALLDAPHALQSHLLQRRGRDEAALIASLLQRVQQMDERSAAGLDAQALRAAIIDLLLLSRPEAVNDASAPMPAGRSAQCLLRVATVIDHALGDPALNAEAIGAALGLSARYIQRLFEYQGTTLSAFVLEQRLQRAASGLREQPRRAIAELAYEAGFGDLSYFCRCFRRRFGCTAREWRLPN